MNEIEQILQHFDQLQLETLAVHVEIHRDLLKKIAQRLECEVKDLPKLDFMHAAKLAFAGRPTDLVTLLQLLDSARNVLAHENDDMKFTEKSRKLQEEVLGMRCVSEPTSLDESRKQAFAALNFLKVTVWNTGV